MRIPSSLRHGVRALRFTGVDVDTAEDGLLGAIIIGDASDAAGNPGPANLHELAAKIARKHRWDGVAMSAGRAGVRAFRDSALRISGRATARVRVVKRHRSKR